MHIITSRPYLRSIGVLTALLCMLVFALGTLLNRADRNIESAGRLLSHANEVISGVQEMETLSESMLAAARGYMISGGGEYLEEYGLAKMRIGTGLDDLQRSVIDNPVQMERVTAMEERVRELSATLELAMADGMGDARREAIRRLRADVILAANDVLTAERDLLEARARMVDEQRQAYFTAIAYGGVGAAVFILLFNAIFLYVRTAQSATEKSLRVSEQRFALAVEGSSDGIFDWDLQSGTVFFSRQFFEMLGIDRQALIGTSDEFKKYLHPDDEDRFWEHLQRYLRGELSEYAHTFRMRHESGRWIWVNSRGKALWDSSGRPVRMVGAHTDITYMKEYQERLKEEKQVAENANRAKSDFLAHMSHEIRTPLTAISGIAEILMRNQDNLGDKQRQMVRTLVTSTASLKDLVSDILDFSKIESGEVEIKNETFGLAEVFQQVISMMSVSAREKGLDFMFDYETLDGVSFYCDRQRLRQVLLNLIGNAVKFTETGSITVTAYFVRTAAGDVLRIAVEDTGIGIAPEHQSVIFERFKQGDDTVSRKYGGTGLGLPISRSLVELMGGELSLETTPGQGSTFIVTLPVLETDNVSHNAAEADRVRSRSLGNHIRAQLTDTAGRVLLVEDYEGNIVVLSFILDELGCDYDVARTGLEGLNLWKEKFYDLILMDIQMPEMDGFTATATIRRIETEKKLPRTPIIGMTAHALVGDKDKCIQAGMDAYLPKPIVEGDLKAEILRHISVRALSAAAQARDNGQQQSV